MKIKKLNESLETENNKYILENLKTLNENNHNDGDIENLDEPKTVDILAKIKTNNPENVEEFFDDVKKSYAKITSFDDFDDDEPDNKTGRSYDKDDDDELIVQGEAKIINETIVETFETFESFDHEQEHETITLTLRMDDAEKLLQYLEKENDDNEILMNDETDYGQNIQRIIDELLKNLL